MELYPTLDMIGDYFTKELQGSQIRHFHNIILGITEDEITSYNVSRRRDTRSMTMLSIKL